MSAWNRYRHDNDPAPGLMQFKRVAGSWSGNDYPTVSVTKVIDSTGYLTALVFMSHMNVDFDGSPNARSGPLFESAHRALFRYCFCRQCPGRTL